MAGIFPESGAPAGPNAPGSQVGVVTNSSTTCPPLFHQGVCIPRFDPASANAVISEIANAVNDADLPYSCETLHNLSLAIQYSIQKGIPRGVSGFNGGGDSYTGGMTPPALGYNNFQTIALIPDITNMGASTLNLDGRGAVPVLRNDGLPVQSGDLRAGTPTILVFYNGSFYIPYLSPSQVPTILSGDLNVWVRPDGDDGNDGSANTPARAFRTITGAWAAVGGRYAASPAAAINIRLGIPGTYESALVGPYGGNLNIIGDPANFEAYVIQSDIPPGGSSYGLALQGINGTVLGVHLFGRGGASVNSALSVGGGSVVRIQNVRTTANTNGVLNLAASTSTISIRGTVIAEKNGFTGAVVEQINSLIGVGFPTDVGTLIVRNTVAGAPIFSVGKLSILEMFPTGSSVTGSGLASGTISGVVTGNSVVELGGQTVPGDPWVTSTGGQVIP